MDLSAEAGSPTTTLTYLGRSDETYKFEACESRCRTLSVGGRGEFVVGKNKGNALYLGYNKAVLDFPGKVKR